MKKLLGLILVALLVLGVAALVGCGGTKTTVKKGEVTTEEGSATVTEEEQELGTPVYPGAEIDENAPGTVKGKNEKGEEVWTAAVLRTDAPISEVIAWYREKLKDKPGFTDLTQKFTNSTTGQQGGMFSYQEGDTYKWVAIGRNYEHREKTDILITTGSAPGGSSTQTP